MVLVHKENELATSPASRPTAIELKTMASASGSRSNLPPRSSSIVQTSESFYRPSAYASQTPRSQPASTINPFSNVIRDNTISSNFNASASAGADSLPAPASAQLVNALIQRDTQAPCFSEAFSSKTFACPNCFIPIGQFSRDYIYGDEKLPILQFNKLSVIPEALLAHIRSDVNNDSSCFMGLFPDINRAWLIAGNALFIWTFENDRDFICFDKMDSDIIDVGLVRARSSVFIDSIEYVLVVVTANEISLLGISFAQKEPFLDGIRNYSMMDMILHETDFRFSSDEVNMLSVCGTPSGRIFLSGSDGHVYELLYQSDRDWLGTKSRKINRTASILNYLWPSFLKFSSNRTRIVKLVYDSTRHMLFGLTESSTVQMFWLGNSGSEFEFMGTTADLATEASRLLPAGVFPSQKSLEVISIFPVSVFESGFVSLVAVCRSGIRLYFSTVAISDSVGFSNQPQLSSSAAPSGLRLVHVRAAPEENRIRDPKKLVHRWSPNIHCSLAGNGTFLAASAISADEDTVVGMIINPSIFSLTANIKLPLEYSIETTIGGKVWAIEEFNLAAHALSQYKHALSHLAPRRQYAVLTNVGVYMFSRLRPLDQLYLLLSDKNINWDSLIQLFQTYGADQMASLCVAICCANETGLDQVSDLSHTVFNNSMAALLKLGGEPRLLESPGNSALQTPFGRDALGKVIATQPEFENSPLHDGLYVFFARLIAGFWKTKLWEFKQPSVSITMQLQRLNKFLTANMDFLTEKRFAYGSFGNKGFDAEELQRRHKLALMSENESLIHLGHFVNLLLELLAFLSICTDYAIFDAVLGTQLHSESAATDIELLLTTAHGRSMINELGNVLVQRQLKGKHPVRGLCEVLRVRCPSYFSDVKVTLQEGLEILHRAKSIKECKPRTDGLFDALGQFVKASAVISLPALFDIMSDFEQLGFHEGALRLGLKYVEVLDPLNSALSLAENPERRLEPEKHEIIRQRNSVYSRLMESIACTGFDVEKTTQIIRMNPDHDIDSIRAKCLAVAGSATDELFHYRFYDWLVESCYTSTLLDLPANEYLIKYLQATFVARSGPHRDLLWKWLAKGYRYNEAASVMSCIATSRGYPLDLGQRIEYLSLAIAHCKSETGGTSVPKHHLLSADISAFNIAPIELAELEEQLVVANVQLEVLNDAINSRLVHDSAIAEINGGLGLLSLSELFNQFSQPFRLFGSCLKIVHCSGLINEKLVSQLWHEVFAAHLGDNMENMSNLAFSSLSSEISTLGRRLYPSPSAFPLAHLIDLLGRAAVRAQSVTSDMIVSTLLSAGVTDQVLFDELWRFWTFPPSRTWQLVEFKTALVEMIVSLLDLWQRNASTRGQMYQNRELLSRLRSLHKSANENGSYSACDALLSLVKTLES